MTAMGIAPTIIADPDIVDIAQKHSAALVLYARQFFAGNNLHAAEDVVQEVLHRLSQQPKVPENLAGWLYTAVRNGAISAARSEKRRTIREAEHQPPMFMPAAENPFDAEEIEQSLAKLDAESREIVMLHIWSDLSFGDIATLLGKTKTTVFRRYKEALEVLRGMMEE
jgi:RNA polymerase sigma factor (sigma-70 family)